MFLSLRELQRSLVGCSPWGRQESDTTERLHFNFSFSRIGEGNGNPLQCSCLENPRDGGAWWAVVYGVAQSRTRLKRLSSSNSSSRELQRFQELCVRNQRQRLTYVFSIIPCLMRACSVVSDSLQPHGLQMTKFLCPLDSPGKNTGVGCHFLLQGNLPNPGIKPGSPALLADSLPPEPPGKPTSCLLMTKTQSYFLNTTQPPSPCIKRSLPMGFQSKAFNEVISDITCLGTSRIMIYKE